MIEAAVHPGPRLGADEGDGLVDRRAGDAGVDGGLDDLEDRAVGGRAIVALVARYQMGLGHLHLVEQHRAARGGALAEARPVVNHGQARRVTLGDGVPGARFLVDGDDRHEMREQGAGRVELAAGDQHMVAMVGEACLELGGALGAELREGVPEADSAQHLAEQELLLRVVGDGADRRHHAEMVLRDLPDAWIGGRDDRDHPGQGDVGQLGSAERLGHVDRPQAALREGIELRHRQPPRAVTLRGTLRELCGKPVGNLDRLGVAPDHVRGRARPRQAGDTLGDALELALDAHVRLLCVWLGVRPRLSSRAPAP